MGAVLAGMHREGDMVPPAAHLPDVLPTERLNARGMPNAPWREQLRRIPNIRNAVAVALPAKLVQLGQIALDRPAIVFGQQASQQPGHVRLRADGATDGF